MAELIVGGTSSRTTVSNPLFSDTVDKPSSRGCNVQCC
jgi:hypothetical protein